LKISIIGSGAMGTIFTFLLNNENQNINLYDKSTKTVNAIKDGLFVNNNNHIEKISVNISNNPTSIKNSDFIFIFVKSYTTKSAGELISKYSPNSIIISLQNGIGNYENLLEFIKEENLIIGTTTFGGFKTDLNRVTFGGKGEIVFGGKNIKSLERLKILFSKSNMSSTISKNIQKDIWKKAIINAGINPLGALSLLTNGQILENNFLMNIQKSIIKEAVDVANANMIEINYDEILQSTITVCKNTYKNSCSMLQDIKFQRKTEIENINGIIVQYGKKFKIPTPTNKKLLINIIDNVAT